MSIDAISYDDITYINPYDLTIQDVSWSKIEKAWNKHRKDIIAVAEAAALLTTLTLIAVTTGPALIAAEVVGGATYYALQTMRTRLEAERGDKPAKTLEQPPSWEPCFISNNFAVPGSLLKNGAISGVAGANASQHENEVYANRIHDLANGSHVHWTYNQSHGIAIDFLETWLFNYHGFSPPAYLLIDLWSQFDNLHQDNPSAKYLQICHSQGASHVRNALQQCPLHIRNRVIVLAFAPSEVVPQALCHSAHNYASSRDIIYYGKLLSLANPSETLASLKELTILTPDPNAPYFDHWFQSPTFNSILEKHITEYINTYG